MTFNQNKIDLEIGVSRLLIGIKIIIKSNVCNNLFKIRFEKIEE